MDNIIFKSFEEAGQTVLKFLYQRFGFNLWMITRTQGEDWIVLQTEDNGYNVKPGQVFHWEDSFCSQMVKGKAPRIAPRSDDIPLYANAPIGKKIDIKAYIGQPLVNEDGSLFGTLCAIDPNPKSASLIKEAGLIDLLGQMLSYILQAELRENKQKRLRERFEVEALSDSLTGVYNRRAWDNLTNAEEERCKRYGYPTAIFILDLNNLKTINDNLGHDAGDQLIQNAATVLRTCVRANDIVARLGGDEFAVLSIEIDQLNAEALLDRMIQAFTEANISVAIGLAMRNPNYGLSSAIKEADEKMFAHKRLIKP